MEWSKSIKSRGSFDLISHCTVNIMKMIIKIRSNGTEKFLYLPVLSSFPYMTMLVLLDNHILTMTTDLRKGSKTLQLLKKFNGLSPHILGCTETGGSFSILSSCDIACISGSIHYLKLLLKCLNNKYIATTEQSFTAHFDGCLLPNSPSNFFGTEMIYLTLAWLLMHWNENRWITVQETMAPSFHTCPSYLIKNYPQISWILDYKWTSMHGIFKMHHFYDFISGNNSPVSSSTDSFTWLKRQYQHFTASI